MQPIVLNIKGNCDKLPPFLDYQIIQIILPPVYQVKVHGDIRTAESDVVDVKLIALDFKLREVHHPEFVGIGKLTVDPARLVRKGFTSIKAPPPPPPKYNESS